MGFIQAVFNNILHNFQNQEISSSVLVSVLLLSGVLALYEFFVYQVVLRRSLYNKAFNICIAILPFFISTIILSLQSNLVITLGTIGALAIIRFRTAVKDPVDLVFILWSIHIGITCGCQMYGMAILTSLIVTVVFIILRHLGVSSKSHVLVIHCASAESENQINEILDKYTKRFRIKSRNHTEKGMDFIFEIITKEAVAISEALEKNPDVERFSLMEYDVDDVL